MRVMLDDEACTELLGFAAQRLADADVPASVLAGLRAGRMVALRKQSGGIRGLVMADVFRRLVSRTLAQQAATAFQESCAPFQYALSTRAGAEALVRGLGLSTELSARATVVSVDGIGAYDHVSRAAMFEGLRRDNRLAGLIPFVRQFYGQESSYLFYDACGRAHDVLQAEGGEQGDPLMPGLFAVAIHPALVALVATQTALRGGERLYAFLDDAYVTCDPERVHATFVALRQALKSHANIDLNVGKTRVWNAAGEEPPGLSEWMPPAQDGSPVWVGDPTLPPELQGIHVLGTPLGHDAFRKAALLAKRCQHDSLLDKLPGLPDLQTAWLLLLMCACPRSNYLLRTMQPSITEEFAARHDRVIMGCLSELLGSDGPLHLDDQALQRAKLPLRLGGLGLRSAEAGRCAAYWASWADTLPTLQARVPELVAAACPLAGNAGAVPATSGVAELLQAATRLNEAGYMVPGWDALLAGGEPPREPAERDHGDTLRGWQRAAAACLDKSACASLYSDLDPASRALMLSQAGPGGSLAITVLPTAPEFRMPSSHMRVLLLRRLRQPLPVAPRACRCGGALDPLGDHRAACPTAGVLGARGAPLEWAAARVCREAGARVASNVMIRDMNLDAPATDARRIEVLANGLPLWQGAQAAVDTTLVSPLTRDGAPRPGADRTAGSAVAAAANRKRRETYPELAVARRCKLVVVGIEVGGRFGAEAAAFLRKLAVARAREVPARLRSATRQASLHRWMGMLATAAQRALAHSLLELPKAGVDACSGAEPPLGELLADVRGTHYVPSSRLPAPTGERG